MADWVGVVLAAGLGTRLRPLTLHTPKPLVPLAGRPLIERALDALDALAVRAVGVNAFHLGDALVEALAHRARRPIVVNEATLQGTGGGLRGVAAALPRASTIAINGDALFDFDLRPLAAGHRARGSEATLVLRRVPRGSPFARVGIDEAGRVHRIAEVEGPAAPPPEALIYGAYTGVQLVEPALLGALPAEGPCDVLRTAYRARLHQGAAIHAAFVPDDSYWLDVGTVPRYLEAHRAVLDGVLRGAPLPPAGPDGARLAAGADVRPGARLIGPCVVEAGARIARGATVGPYAFIGAGAVVAAGAVLSDCVVWAGARAEGVVHGDVVLPARSRTYLS